MKAFKNILGVKNFFKKWNGAVVFPIVLAVFFISNYILSNTTGDEYPLLAVVGVALAVAKIFLAEFIGSVLLYINQNDYFKVIHDQDDPKIDLKYKTQPWRDAAIKFYILYCVLAGLVLAFA
jgi:hypothetical protein